METEGEYEGKNTQNLEDTKEEKRKRREREEEEGDSYSYQTLRNKKQVINKRTKKYKRRTKVH